MRRSLLSIILCASLGCDEAAPSPVLGPPPPRARITGVVTTQGSGSPVVGASVSLRLWTSGLGAGEVSVGQGYTGADGRYSFQVGYPPRGATLSCTTLRLEASAAAHLPQSVPACDGDVLRDTVDIELLWFNPPP